MTKTITIKVQLEEWEFNILQHYGYDIPKNVVENLKQDAYWIFIASKQSDEEDIGTATVNEMRKQNGEF